MVDEEKYFQENVHYRCTKCGTRSPITADYCSNYNCKARLAIWGEVVDPMPEPEPPGQDTLVQENLERIAREREELRGYQAEYEEQVRRTREPCAWKENYIHWQEKRLRFEEKYWRSYAEGTILEPDPEEYKNMYRSAEEWQKLEEAQIEAERKAENLERIAREREELRGYQAEYEEQVRRTREPCAWRENYIYWQEKRLNFEEKYWRSDAEGAIIDPDSEEYKNMYRSAEEWQKLEEAQIEAEQKAKEEAEEAKRKAEEEAKRKAREEAKRKAREEAERQKAENLERIALERKKLRGYQAEYEEQERNTGKTCAWKENYIHWQEERLRFEENYWSCYVEGMILEPDPENYEKMHRSEQEWQKLEEEAKLKAREEAEAVRKQKEAQWKAQAKEENKKRKRAGRKKSYLLAADVAAVFLFIVFTSGYTFLLLVVINLWLMIRHFSVKHKDKAAWKKAGLNKKPADDFYQFGYYFRVRNADFFVVADKLLQQQEPLRVHGLISMDECEPNCLNFTYTKKWTAKLQFIQHDDKEDQDIYYFYFSFIKKHKSIPKDYKGMSARYSQVRSLFIEMDKWAIIQQQPLHGDVGIR